MYASYGTAFGGGDMEELDKMAEAINNSTKEKSNNFKSFEHPSRIPDMTQVTSGQQFKYFSTQGNLTSDINQSNYYKYINKGVPIPKPQKVEDSEEEPKSETKLIERKDYETVLRELAKKDIEVQKNIEKTSDYQNKINTLIDLLRDHHTTDMTGGKTLDDKLEHIKSCKACREEFDRLLNNTNHVFKQQECNLPNYYKSKPYPINSAPLLNKVTHLTQNPEKPSESVIEGFGNLFGNSKDIVIGILIGVIILLLLETMQKSQKK